MSNRLDANLKEILFRHDVTYQAFGRAVKLNRAAVYRLIRSGEFPVRDPESRQRVQAFLSALLPKVAAPVPENPVPSICAPFVHIPVGKKSPGVAATASGESPDAKPIEKEQHMLIQKQGVSPDALKFWGLSPASFAPPYRAEDVFLGGEMRVTYEHMRSKALYGGLMAVVGESGAGKTTLKDRLVTELSEAGEVLVIEPHLQAMEETDKTGKTLKTRDINEAILREVEPRATMKRTMEAQLTQIATALATSAGADYQRRHLLVIDEAHALPKPTLRHLKRFLEMKNPKIKGLQRPLLAILLLGQPELATRLSPFDPSVREVWQRCEVVHLPPLGKALEGYIKFRFPALCGVFGPDALVALGEKLASRGSLYPLAVDNWVAHLLSDNTGLHKVITAEHVLESYLGVETLHEAQRVELAADVQKGGRK